MEKIISGLLVLVGVIHLLPLVGVMGPAKLSTLYDITLKDPNLVILMQHRAVLFGLLGAFLVYAAFRSELHVLAMIAGFVSVVSFLVIAWLTGGYNGAVQKVVVVDLVALVALVLAAILHMVRGTE